MYELNDASYQRIKPNLTRNMELGKNAEKCISWFVSNIWKIPIKYTNYEKYQYGEGADFWNRDMGLWGEVKNLSGDYYVTKKWVQENIINRIEKWVKIKILFISYLRAIPKIIRNELDSKGWIIIEFGRQIDSNSWEDIIQKLSNKLNHKIWSIYYQYIKPYIPKYSNKSSYVQSRLDSTAISCICNNSSTNNIYNVQHGWYNIIVSNRLLEGKAYLSSQQEIKNDNNKFHHDIWIKL